MKVDWLKLQDKYKPRPPKVRVKNKAKPKEFTYDNEGHKYEREADGDDPAIQAPWWEQRAERRANAAIERDAAWERYQQGQRDRIKSARAKHPGIERFIVGLTKLQPDYERIGKDDTNLNIAEYAERCRLDALPTTRLRYLVVELSRMWVQSLRASGSVQTSSDYEAAPWVYDEPPPSALDELKTFLRI